jgi:farnesyl-diphosphate farnesyltransferase
MMQIEEHTEYCIEMLPQVSRTFAPTIRMLPKNLSIHVTVAYLLCRIADTVEDEASLGAPEKRKILNIFADIFREGDATYIEDFDQGISTIRGRGSDFNLLQNFRRVLAVFDTFRPEVRGVIGTWVVEMTLGMIKFAQSSTRKKRQFLKSMKDLDEYTYYVAGTVGHLLTSLFAHFSKKITPPIVQRLERFSASFGKGLQLVNIIRDMTVDLRRGQSYIPEEILRKYRLNRQSIFEMKNSKQAEHLFNELIQMAVSHLDQAIAYVLTLPKEEARIRIFCLLPLFWAMQTLRLIQSNTQALLEIESIKISRWVIKTEFFKVMLLTFSNRLTLRHYNKIRKNIALQPLAAI